ncbi:MAG: tRNA 2-selenouridine(34) synthase MnmH [Rhodocyclaceae bacterium]|nr:tRNA 2-selenouridine(34) synthase MnmH [Rhodocyclaceae bacterium]
MSSHTQRGVATLAQLGDFDEILDARSPAEFADDHVPGAVSRPVLDNEERIRVGTLYKQVSPFEAKKLGAALVAKNIATHLQAHYLDQPKTWRPLVYCWRGGQRSGAFTHILREIGWDAHRLEGGYKTWRSHVVASLVSLPDRFRYTVISGATGSGKSRLLEALASEGAQVLHLEALAAHKGSLLGALPNQPQPSQRSFESALLAALEGFDPQRPVFVEAESRRIGAINLPETLISRIRSAPCLRVEASIEARVAFLLQDYAYFLADPAWLLDTITRFQGMQSNDTLARWRSMVDAREFEPLVRELLEQHYDPLYQRSQSRNYTDYEAAAPLVTDDLSPDAVRALAQRVLAAE